MKKYSILFCLFLQMVIAFAQAPEKMSYQAVVRNNNNVLVSNHAVGMRISILQGSATGAAVYTETQTPTTNANGLISIEIGTGSVVIGTFTNIDWANGPYFIKTETDPNGGTAYTLTASNQLLSVPYALYAKTAQTALNGVPSGSQHGQTLTNCDGNIVWTYNGQCPAKITGFNCADTVHAGALFTNLLTGTAMSTISYSGGNGGIYPSQSISSNGVTGLTATLAAGTLSNGNGTLSFSITGTPTSSGIASFSINFAGKTCNLSRTVLATPTYAANSVYCNGTATAVVNVTNPTTGKIWMDRNLGAAQAATSSTDAAAYGDLYQWGRRADGHQCRNSGTTSTLSSTDQPTHANFIVAPNSPYDWRTPQNDNLWQGVNGINNPCPTGYKLPSKVEWVSEINSWSQSNSFGAFSSINKFTVAGDRMWNDGNINMGTINAIGSYWTSTINGIYSHYIDIEQSVVSYVTPFHRAHGMSVRCIKD
jgi:uncharacterized protein (TIGR02145 family)